MIKQDVAFAVSQELDQCIFDKIEFGMVSAFLKSGAQVNKATSSAFVQNCKQKREQIDEVKIESLDQLSMFLSVSIGQIVNT